MALIEKFMDFDKKPTDTTTKEVMTKQEAKQAAYAVRTLGDVRVAAEAQRIFNPGLPPTKPKGPTAAQQNSGTVAAAGMQGNWGTNGQV